MKIYWFYKNIKFPMLKIQTSHYIKPKNGNKSITILLLKESLFIESIFNKKIIANCKVYNSQNNNIK